MTDAPYRTERDSMGEVRVPGGALWGAQTQRAVQNFSIAARRLPPEFIRALALVKAAAARANAAVGLLDRERAGAIAAAAAEVAAGRHAEQFPVDVFQTGSGTSSNMNVNEVLANLAARSLARDVHPNDHVNMGQSSNDVVPSAIHVAAMLALRERLLPALQHLAQGIGLRESALGDAVKTGRTHLMDAMPLTLGQELSGWRSLIEQCGERLRSCEPRLLALAIGGTAVGTGINADPRFAAACCAQLAQLTGLAFVPGANRFAALASQDAAVELSGQLKVAAVALMKIANDLRWMNSGPLAGLGEITLPALQPGSSIMPGKVNPVIPEAVAMAAAQVVGNDAAITLAGQSGNFQLNVMLPLIADRLLDSADVLARAARSLADDAIAGFTVNRERLGAALAGNPVLVTALNPVIGYEQGAAIAKRAVAEGRSVREVAAEMTGLPREQLDELLDPLRLTLGGLEGTGGAGG
ncbi:MAG: class II fumarate hydratase [Steroidobacteraceae bacterium]